MTLAMMFQFSLAGVTSHRDILNPHALYAK